MSWQVLQTNRFASAYKKLSDQVAFKVDEQIELIVENPDIGQRKKGDLANLWVHKFKFQTQLYLLGYTRDNEIRVISLEAIGSHQNFYRDQKR